MSTYFSPGPILGTQSKYISEQNGQTALPLWSLHSGGKRQIINEKQQISELYNTLEISMYGRKYKVEESKGIRGAGVGGGLQI